MFTTYQDIYLPLDSLPIKGVSQKTLLALSYLNIHTFYDMLYYFPRGYDDRTNIKPIKDLIRDEYVVIKASLMSVIAPPTRTGKKMVKAVATDGTGIIEIIWFGMPFLKRSLKLNEEYLFIGQIKMSGGFQLINPEYRLLKNQIIDSGEILPVYSANKLITQNVFRKITKTVLENFTPLLEENIPKNIADKYKIMDRKKAIREIHLPTSHKNIEEAKRRFAIEELLVLEVGILKNRFLIDSLNNKLYTLDDKKDLVKTFLASLKFELTKAQKKVITEIYTDLANGRILNRLLQGDVGSGKTIVAIILLLYMVENSYQGVFMAPTEILAIQHFLSSQDIFHNLGINVELLTGSIKGKAREKLLQNLKLGQIDILIGTHALIEENVEFHNLGLIVIDEQHRFGVVQRKKLRDKGSIANLLVMSATPIPRSLALSIYGDLDVSIIDELPPGRIPIKTKWIKNSSESKKMYDFIKKKLIATNQVYFVVPLIEESTKLLAKSIEEVLVELKANLPNFSIGILHGRMKNKEKDEIMTKFKKKEINILLSTTVIEVGIDVPNATIMTIFNAERFGLSALHQLRGRVGRGGEASYCFLISYTDNADSQRRLEIMEKTQDGFKIAEEDLKIRNTGEIFGLKQSGFSDLKFIDIIQDVKTIKLVRDESMEYLKKNNGKITNKFLEMDILKKFREDEID